MNLGQSSIKALDIEVSSLEGIENVFNLLNTTSLSFSVKPVYQEHYS